VITYFRIGHNGRLGNQMFQYATLVSIAEKNGYKYVLPSSCIERSYDAYYNALTQKRELAGFDLFDSFEIECDLIDDFELSKKIFYVYQEIGNVFAADIFRIPDFSNIEGYFQSEKYFIDSELEIRKQFIFKKEILDSAVTFINSIRGKPLVSLHVRRGDYISLQSAHPLCTMEYYNFAISELESLLGEVRVLVISDDIEWCKQNFIGEKYVFSEGCSGIEDMARMSLCDHNIIANSSFSWWGAWLNNHKNKLVYAPEKWFGPKFANHSLVDLFPEKWRII